MTTGSIKDFLDGRMMGVLHLFCTQLTCLRKKVYLQALMTWRSRHIGHPKP